MLRQRPVAIVFHRFGPYHLARLKAAASRLPVVGIEIVARDSTYRWEPMPGAEGWERLTLFESESDARRGGLCRKLWEALDKARPSVVALPGWSAPEALAGLAWCVSRSVPALAMSASQVHDRPRSALREQVKRRIVRFYSAALVGGRRHAEYCARLGVPNHRIFTGYDVVDNEHFARGAAAARSDALLRRHMGLPERFFLVSCRFEPVKNLPGLLEAYARYRRVATQPWALVLLGDGRLAGQVRREIRRLALADSVLLPGFRQYHELPAYYGLASCFILASTSETWGLVVNEAMAAGLPVLVSNRCGCAPELVEEGRNGFTFDPYNVEELAGLMLRISALSEEQVWAMGERSREIISRWTPETFAESLVKAVEAAVRAPQVKATLFDRALLWALIHLR